MTTLTTLTTLTTSTTLTELLALLAAVFALNGLLLLYLNHAFRSPAYARFRFREPIAMRVSPARQRLNALANGVLSTSLIFGFTVAAHGRVITDGALAYPVMIGHALWVLLLYDFLYYLAHRWLFHHKRLMRLMHGVHHRARYPSAQESLWLHPAETVAGLVLLALSICLSGPVHVYTFLLIMLLHTTSNLIVHAGLEFPRFPMRLFNPLIRAHHGHHMIDPNGNYANLTRIWDRLLGTDIA